MSDREEENQGWERTILGVDPGSQVTGYALIEAKEKSFQRIDSGVCQLSSKTNYFQKLSMLSRFFLELTDSMGPFDLAIESLAYVKNVNSFGKLAQARGAILAALEPRAERIQEYPPNLVKSTVSGYGHASKQSIQKSLGFVMGHQSFSTHDESDALAVALCHHFQRGRGAEERSKASGGHSLSHAFKGRA